MNKNYTFISTSVSKDADGYIIVRGWWPERRVSDMGDMMLFSQLEITPDCIFLEYAPADHEGNDLRNDVSAVLDSLQVPGIFRQELHDSPIRSLFTPSSYKWLNENIDEGIVYLNAGGKFVWDMVGYAKDTYSDDVGIETLELLSWAGMVVTGRPTELAKFYDTLRKYILREGITFPVTALVQADIGLFRLGCIDGISAPLEWYVDIVKSKLDVAVNLIGTGIEYTDDDVEYVTSLAYRIARYRLFRATTVPDSVRTEVVTVPCPCGDWTCGGYEDDEFTYASFDSQPINIPAELAGFEENSAVYLRPVRDALVDDGVYLGGHTMWSNPDGEELDLTVSLFIGDTTWTVTQANLMGYRNGVYRPEVYPVTS